LKWDGQWDAWSATAPDANDCIRFHPNGGDVVRSNAVADDFQDLVPVTIIDEFHWQIGLPLPAGYEFVAGYTKSGDARQVGCRPAEVDADSIDFFGPPQ
jgi:hypothetical protein